ncbi:MAG TPA: carboxymuconolactone decarboxylase family protein [Burkholderiales bacterium]|nr:carboxymuconolactone decarboxylase family protein [Burkholderiales bacterium]
MSILKSKPGPINLRDIFGLMPKHAERIVRYYEDVLRGPSPLTPAERELIYTYCAALNRCHYAYTSHKACAIALGISPRVFTSRGIDRAAIPAKLQTILAFAHKLTISPGRMRAADSKAIYRAGWGEQAIIDTIVVASLANWISRVLNGFSASAPDEHHRQAGERLAAGGYLPVARQVKKQLKLNP